MGLKFKYRNKQIVCAYIFFFNVEWHKDRFAAPLRGQTKSASFLQIRTHSPKRYNIQAFIYVWHKNRKGGFSLWHSFKVAPVYVALFQMALRNSI